MVRRIFFALALTTIFSRADVLANSDFSQGKAHWGGDARELDSDSASVLSGGSANGVVIHLNKDKPTKIYQNFTVRSTNLYYSIRFKLSANYHLTDDKESRGVPIDRSELPPGVGVSAAPSDRWQIFARDPAPPFSTSSSYITPIAQMTNVQTFTGKMDQLPRDAEAIFLLLLPPGEGTVTLLNCSLTPDDPTAGN